MRGNINDRLRSCFVYPYEGLEMIPEAGLSFSVDKAPYSIVMIVSIVSAYRLKARRGLFDSFFFYSGFCS